MQKQRKTSNTTTSEIVLESLREQIINGILQPQEKLVEAEIARKFGLSRGPVREALRQLSVEGLDVYKRQSQGQAPHLRVPGFLTYLPGRTVRRSAP